MRDAHFLTCILTLRFSSVLAEESEALLRAGCNGGAHVRCYSEGELCILPYELYVFPQFKLLCVTCVDDRVGQCRVSG